MNARRLISVIVPNEINTAKIAVDRVAANSVTSNTRRRLRISAKAPAGSPKMNIGRAVITCTMATARGSGFKSVISQLAAALCIQIPTLDTSVATHRTVNARLRKGPRGDAEDGEELVAVIFRESSLRIRHF